MLHPPLCELLHHRNEGIAHLRVEGPVEGEDHRAHPRSRERVEGGAFEVRRDGIRLLARRIVNGKHDLARGKGGDNVVYLAGVPHEHAHHRNWRKAAMVHGLVNDGVNVPYHAHPVWPRRALARRAGAHHGRKVAARKADHAVRGEAACGKHASKCRACGVCRYKGLRIRPRLEYVGVVPVVWGRREYERRRGELVIPCQRLLKLVEYVAALRLGNREVAQHVRVVARDSGIDECKLAAARSYQPVAGIV